MPWTWKDEIVEVLTELGGEAYLPDIIKKVHQRGKKSVVNESSTRDVLERHCPDKYFISGVEVFYHAGSERSGLYGLSKRNKPGSSAT